MGALGGRFALKRGSFHSFDRQIIPADIHLYGVPLATPIRSTCPADSLSPCYFALLLGDRVIVQKSLSFGHITISCFRLWQLSG